MWSKPLLCRFRQSGKIQQTQVLQGFAAFHNAPSRIPPRHSQSRRATNCATPRYEVRRSGWAYSPKCRALPTAPHPDIHFSAMIPRQRGKSWFSLHAVKSHETIRVTPCYPTMPQLKKQQEAGRFSARLPHF